MGVEDVGVQQMLPVAANKTGRGGTGRCMYSEDWECIGGGDSCTVRSAGPWGKGAGTRWGPCIGVFQRIMSNGYIFPYPLQTQ